MEQLLKRYRFTTPDLRKICLTFSEELRNALARDTHQDSSLKCFPTYVHTLPNGDEFGKVLILDLAGVTFRIVLIALRAEFDSEIDEEFFTMKLDQLVRSGEELFDYIVDCLVVFLKGRDLSDKLLPLGVTFPFQCQPQSLKSTKLLQWSKGFRCSGVENEDVAELLEAAIARRPGELQINLVSVLDSTIGTLIACAHRNAQCRIGCFIGNDTNATYVEQSKKVEFLSNEERFFNQHVIINTEWGSFGDNGCLNFIRTDEDLQIDNKSSNHGRRIFEKMVSESYLGEILRLLLLKAIKQKLIFEFYQEQEKLVRKLSFHHVMDASLIYTIEDDDSISFERSREWLQHSLDLAHIPGEDMCRLQKICKAVGKRSAQLLGVCLGVLVNRINASKVIVAIDGNVYRVYAKYDVYLKNMMRRVVHRDLDFDVIFSDDGAGQGTAIVTLLTALAEQEQNESFQSFYDI